MTVEIAKAVVLAGACPSTSPWPSVGVAARQLAPVANRPVLFHHLDALACGGVRQAAIVTDSTTSTSIPSAVGDGSAWGLELTFVQVDAISEVFASPAVASFVGAEPVFVHHGDILLRERLSVLKDDFADRDLDALILRAEPASGGFPGSSAGYIFGPDVLRIVGHPPAILDDVWQQMSALGTRVSVREVDACMPCRGGAEELLEANRRMLEQMVPATRSERVFDSQIQGLVALHPSAEVRDSIIRGPVAIGPGARIDKSYVGPYTSIGAGAYLDCVEIEHSIVLDGAELRFLPSRVEGSLIGPGARVAREFRMPRALRLWIGGGAQVSLDA